MTQEKMTIHKALVELKIMDSRIISSIQSTVFCKANKYSNEKIDGITVDAFKEQIKSGYQRAVDLINRRDVIKRAVVNSNAVTKVQIGDSEYTVAEAIEMKNHGIEYKVILLDAMRFHLNDSVGDIKSKNGEDLERRAEQYVIGIYGSKEGKTNPEDFEKTKRDFIKSNSYELVDPLHVADKIVALEKEIAEFRTEVDSVLSTSNAITEIEIAY